MADDLSPIQPMPGLPDDLIGRNPGESSEVTAPEDDAPPAREDTDLPGTQSVPQDGLGAPPAASGAGAPRAIAAAGSR
ncbi:MAG TPA: hypothetical protein VKY74_15545 [Chloroflexia bacterium]|nr:hypothetical protein [Chloroflexia bacterium]